jgi:hypothetical protein
VYPIAISAMTRPFVTPIVSALISSSNALS